MKIRKVVKRSLAGAFLIFVLLNVVVFFHAYRFTHFANSNLPRTQSPDKLSLKEKVKTALFGANMPRPTNKNTPDRPFKTIVLNSNKSIECWEIKTSNAKGTVVICHGYAGAKSRMLDKAEIFLDLGYNAFLIDFRGSGGSEGNSTTVGFDEAKEVKDAYDYLKEKGEAHIILFGTSMGAAAALKAVSDYDIAPDKLILECPFGTMYETVCARFNNMGIPSFPLAGMLVFWGGVQHGFWAFGHCPEEYARAVDCPVLLMYGETDANVSRKETDAIYANLPGKKKLVIFPGTGHENYLIKNRGSWSREVQGFLGR